METITFFIVAYGIYHCYKQTNGNKGCNKL